MRQKWWRDWLFLALIGAAFGVVAVYLIMFRLTKEEPNYSRIEDGLYLGGRVSDPPPGTQAVLNLCELEDPYRVNSQKWEPIHDAEPVPTLDWLREQVGFIESERAAGRIVFVHCRNGVSRSGMVMAAYLMRRENWSREKALEFLRSRRPGVNPNPAFMQLLLEWERSLKR